ncbi:MAG: DUF4405 domain-containing protein [Oscillospiraceae bacterium]|nr:DUF4405 domain-containing protein [Oscillospiraceae bacterium]
MTDTGRQRTNRNVNGIIDLMMVLLLPLLMAYSLIGETFHEAAGTAMLVLFIVHLILHRRWWKAVPKGRYSAYRTFITVMDLILLILMLAQPLSGIAISHHLYVFLRLTGVAAAARDVHLVLGYWSYVLMSVHLGLHVDAAVRAVRRGREIRPAAKRTLRIVILLISAYGVYAFVHRGLPGYMFMRTMFAYFDFGEPLAYFIADYLAVMVLFAAAGYYTGKLLKTKKENRTK